MNYCSEQEIAQAIEPVLEDAELARQLAAQSRPAVWLQTQLAQGEDEIPLGATKLGGCPDLPAQTRWPERGPYPDTHQRVESHRADSVAPNSRWRWAKPEQAQKFRAEALQHVERLLNPFPLHFLAQINFADVWAAGPVDEDMPRSGLLSLFYDLVEQPWGYDPADACSLKALWHEAGSQLQRHEQPAALQAISADWQIKPATCELHACRAPLPIESAQWNALQLPLTEEQEDAFAEWWFDEAQNDASNDGEDACCHRIGGWPTPVQGDMQTECALVAAGQYCGNGQAYQDPALQAVRETAGQWLLLLQLGTDEKLGMNWGDNGQLYLWIRRDDLRARRFDKAWLVLQCH